MKTTVRCKKCNEEMEMFGVTEGGEYKYCCNNKDCDNHEFEYIRQKTSLKKLGLPIIGTWKDY